MNKILILNLYFVYLLLANKVDADISPKVSNAGKVERHVVYGNYSGMALMMDIYYPEKQNGHGVIQISGSGFTRSLSLDAELLSDWRHVKYHSEPLLEAGYTVFALNHRMTPRFKYPSQISDVQRAVRFIRHNAKRFQIDPERIGAIGESSGGYLAIMLGLLEGDENIPDDHPINALSAKVQCVVALGAPIELFGELDLSFYLGFRRKEQLVKGSIENAIATEASPLSHVSRDDAPILMIHSDSDEKVGFSHSKSMYNKLKSISLPTNLIQINGANHELFINGRRVDSFTNDYVLWMDKHLRGEVTESNARR